MEEGVTASVDRLVLLVAASRAEKGYRYDADKVREETLTNMIAKQKTGPFWNRRAITREEAERWFKNSFEWDRDWRRVMYKAERAKAIKDAAACSSLTDFRLDEDDIALLRNQLGGA